MRGRGLAVEHVGAGHGQPLARLVGERHLDHRVQRAVRDAHRVAVAVPQVVLEAARDVPFTLPDTDKHRTQVWLVGYGDSCLKFELIVWPTLEAVKRPKAMNAAYTWAIDDALCKAGIEIPYPQRDVRLRAFFGEEGEDALDALNLKRKPHVVATPQPTTVNDAADDLLRPEPEPEPEEAPTPSTEKRA